LFLVFTWFGALKVAGRSPAGDLVAATVPFLPARTFVIALGVWEVAIGLLFVFPAATRWAVALLLPQMAGTFLPLIVLPDRVFVTFPWVLTLEGQYIVKNVALIALAIEVVGERSRDNAPEPEGAMRDGPPCARGAKR